MPQFTEIAKRNATLLGNSKEKWSFEVALAVRLHTSMRVAQVEQPGLGSALGADVGHPQSVPHGDGE